MAAILAEVHKSHEHWRSTNQISLNRYWLHTVLSLVLGKGSGIVSTCCARIFTVRYLSPGFRRPRTNHWLGTSALSVIHAHFQVGGLFKTKTAARRAYWSPRAERRLLPNVEGCLGSLPTLVWTNAVSSAPPCQFP